MKRSTVLAVLLGVTLVASAAAAGVAASEPSAAIVARYPDEGGMTETAVVTPADVASVGTVQEGRSGGWQVTLTLTERGAESFSNTLVDVGFTSGEGVGNCPVSGPERNDQRYCLLTVVEGEVVSAYALGPSLARTIESGEFAENPRFVLAASNRTTVERAAAAFGNATGSAATDEATPDDASQSETTTDASESDTTAADAPEPQRTSAPVPGFQVGVALAAVAIAVGGFRRRR